MKLNKIKIGRILVLKSRKKLLKLGVTLAWSLLGDQFFKITAVYPAVIGKRETYIVEVNNIPVTWKLNCFKGF